MESQQQQQQQTAPEKTQDGDGDVVFYMEEPRANTPNRYADIFDLTMH